MQHVCFITYIMFVEGRMQNMNYETSSPSLHNLGILSVFAYSSIEINGAWHLLPSNVSRFVRCKVNWWNTQKRLLRATFHTHVSWFSFINFRIVAVLYEENDHVIVLLIECLQICWVYIKKLYHKRIIEN